MTILTVFLSLVTSDNFPLPLDRSDSQNIFMKQYGMGTDIITDADPYQWCKSYATCDTLSLNTLVAR